jgi:hypothetical protein
MGSKRYDPPPLKSSLGDNTQTLARAGLAAVPGVGGSATELLDWLMTPPLLRRQQEWRELVAEAIRTMMDGLDMLPETLAEDDRFFDAVAYASRIALRTSQEEKLKALRAAILNSVGDDAPDAAMQHMFLNYVDEFTVWHMKLLKLFDEPYDWDPEGTPVDDLLHGVVKREFPELQEKLEFAEQVWKDLCSRGLADAGSMLGHRTTMGCQITRRTTKLGRLFLVFITERESLGD